MITKIKMTIQESINTKLDLLNNYSFEIEDCAKIWIKTIQDGGKILFCGNGGSASDAQHIATELMVRLRHDNNRPAIPAIALTTDTSLLTAAANDLGFSEIFARQIEGLAQKNDLVVGISTSGNSPNILRAIETANRMGVKTQGFLGMGGGKLKQMVKSSIIVPSDNTARIQESHILIGHILCELTEVAIHG